MEGKSEKTSTRNLSHTEHNGVCEHIAEPRSARKATPRRITRLSKQARDNTASQWKTAREDFLRGL